MRPRRVRLPILAFTTSIIAHAMLLVVLPMALSAAAIKDQPDAPPPNQQARAMELPVEVELGIDEPTPPTPAWLGFVEPEPQRAEPSIVEQAAFTEEPAAAPSRTAPPVNEAPADAVEAALAKPNPVEQPAQQPPQPSEQELAGVHRPAETGEVTVDPLMPPPNDSQSPTEAMKELIEHIQDTLMQAAQPVQPAQAQPQPAPPDQPRDEPQVNPRPVQSDRPTEPGEVSDKESSPTSIIDVPPDQWQLGKPLARHGLVIKPRRPTFTLLTMMTAAPGNPLCEVSFGRDGVPVVAKLLRSTGDPRVDSAILASLYRWRAEGAELEKLHEGETLDVRLQIILNRRSAA